MENNVMALKNGDNNDIMVSEKDLELIIQEADKRVEILKRVLGVAVKRTNAKDWVDQQGHPYLTASGSEKIAPLFGIKMDRLSDKRDEREDDKGKYYIYTFQATFFWKGGSIEAIGTCSSRDKFFSWDSGKKEWKPLSDFDETNIKKAAYSNLMVNGITRVLGIRNLTWEDLEPFGIKKSDCARVEYGKGAQGGKTASADDVTKQTELGNIILEKCGGDIECAKKKLVEITAFKGRDNKMVPGVESCLKLTGTRLNIALSKAKELKEVVPDVDLNREPGQEG